MKNKVYQENVLGHPLSEYNTSKPQYFIGFFENLSYYNFEKYRDDLIKEFTLNVEFPKKYKKYIDLIENTNSISIHLRRTDHGFHGFVPIDFYEKAIEYMNTHVENPHYFVFSDDIKFAKDNLKINGNVTFINGTSSLQPIFDFELMRKCKHNIIANSTFSWWAAFLNIFKNKIIIGPKIWTKGRNSNYILPKYFVII